MPSVALNTCLINVLFCWMPPPHVPSLSFQGLSMRTNYQATYAQMDMGSSNYFSYNVAALASMTNQQLEVSNELHMPPLSSLPPPPTAWRPTFLRSHC